MKKIAFFYRICCVFSIYTYVYHRPNCHFVGNVLIKLKSQTLTTFSRPEGKNNPQFDSYL